MSASSINYLLVSALEMETPGLEHFAPIVFTGIGKVNAAIQLYQGIQQHQPDIVINYGTAGSVGHHTGLLKVDTFVQRDMDVRPLGVPRGVTPFTEEKLPEAKGIVLGTGDSFVIDKETQLDGLEVELDLIDMEAFALNEVCKHHNVEFHSYKYVTDSTDSDSSDHWQENVSKGAELFAEMLLEQYGKSKLLR